MCVTVEVRAAVNGTIAYLKKHCFIELQAPPPDLRDRDENGNDGMFASWQDSLVGFCGEADLRARECVHADTAMFNKDCVLPFGDNVCPILPLNTCCVSS